VSTKIHYGKRFPKTKITAFTNTVRLAQYKLILERARGLAARMRPEKLDRDTWDHRVMKLVDMLRKIAQQPQRWSPFDLECGWRIWLPERGRWAYTSPWGERYTRDRLEMPAYVEDYHYWNNTDPPEGMREGAGYRRWRRRAKDWECATEPGGQANCLQLVVFEAKDFLSACLHVDLQNAGMPSVVELLAAVVSP
jgi:hypothetical protein